MKKAVSMLLCAVLVFLCVYLLIPKQDSADEIALGEYLNNLSSFKTPVREYGTPAILEHMDTGISVGILYPVTECSCLDEEITQWVENLAEEYISNAGENLSEESAELTVSYDSYLVGNATVSVKMAGTYFSAYMAHPIDIIKTFTADIRSGKMLCLQDILKKDAYQSFEKMIAGKSGVDSKLVDEHFLDNAVVTREGIEIILNRGDYLPMSDGVKVITLGYEEIRHLLADSFDYTAQTEPGAEGPDIPITQKEPAVKIDPDKPMLALTFDDGPSIHTERLLDIFRCHGGQGTFFVLGNLITGRENTLVRIVNEGHEIGNHSWDHRQLTNLSEEEVKDEIMMTRAKIYDVTGTDCTIMRPPYGSCNDAVKSVGKELGVYFVHWSVDTLDWKTKDAEAVYEEIINNASDGAIILCHDLHKTTVDAMETVIPRLIEEGYQLVTVSQLMEYSDSKPEPGKMYYRQ